MLFHTQPLTLSVTNGWLQSTDHENSSPHARPSLMDSAVTAAVDSDKPSTTLQTREQGKMQGWGGGGGRQQAVSDSEWG